MESTSGLTVEQLHQIEKGVLDDVFTILKHQREPLIQLKREGNLMTGSSATALATLNAAKKQIGIYKQQILGEKNNGTTTNSNTSKDTRIVFFPDND
ncbi:hypothetical protein [Furfurilactobacillus rossiae]|uniref:Uncharacterized protein n=1 Tax=Furfurilactobacillus rossiae DSM 15814 TaxID=1114972 RepID=A0A0R1RK69_9LACO|nr:hypothetical protein [Furfurilactobacillus rossiae]KRL56638.1 hypothetical protein FD35_GL001734 [Furfurilactobacillus rossiae DSM 15814]QFR66460.1 hypothetical protein LR814_04845 [Furfurilactobacillus rossiae]QLE61919.1 hypothetical protein LROSRS0_1874 [Furfurilactobacillus rossiae]